jgi:hypothetical protein
VIDSATGQARPLVDVRGYWIGLSVRISRDDRWITYTETGAEGDIWLADLVDNAEPALPGGLREKPAHRGQ